MNKKKKLLCIILAIALIAAFLIIRNSSESGKEFTDGIISTVTGSREDETVTSPEKPAGKAEEKTDEADVAREEVQESDFTFSVEEPQPGGSQQPGEQSLDEDGVYDSKEEVALYLHTFGHLPSNYITKDEAMAQGWSGSGSDKLDKYCPGKCIGGDRFGNREGLLPKASGRSYKECDIDTLGAKQRGVKRIVFSNDGLIYYTDDHYSSFTLLYGEP